VQLSQKSNTNQCCAYWSGLGAFWNGNEEENNDDGCGDGIESHCGKGYFDVLWQKDHSWGRGWWANSGKGGGGRKGGKGSGGGYKIPISGGGKGGGGKVGGDEKL